MPAVRSSHLPAEAATRLHPRKRPQQERSRVAVEAILDATLQVLIADGKDRLTTTAVARRAGVSVGTLYQYFPNKSSLLRGCLERHMGEIRDSIAYICQGARGQLLRPMVEALTDSYFEAKLRNRAASAALYSVSSSIEGQALSQAVMQQSTAMVTDLLATAPDLHSRDPRAVASMVLAALQGVSRRALESADAALELSLLMPELGILLGAYLDACSAP
jgi:AcrR family transcriptional regulator